MLARLKSLYGAAIQRSAEYNLPLVAALLILPSLGKMKAGVGANRRTIMVLPKDGFTQDIMGALSDDPGIAVIGFPRMVLRRLSRAFLPYFMDNNNYISCGPEFDAAKMKYRRFLKVLFGMLRRLIRIDAVMSGNFAYAPDRELASAMTEMGIPFVVLHKENLKTPGRLKFFEHVYRERRGPFTGHKILVYNETERDLQIRTGVAAPAAVEIVGMPRLDRVHAWRRVNAGATVPNSILFFVFSPQAGIPRLGRKLPKRGDRYYEPPRNEGEKVSLAQLSDESCRALVRIARENSDISVVVKSKGRLRDFTETAPLFGVQTEAELPRNMQVVHGGDILPLIAKASVVCGFNSTALLEAVAAGKPVVIPWFAEAQSPRAWPYLVDLRNICVTAESADDLCRKLVDLAHHPVPTPSELQLDHMQSLALWTGNDDGQAAQRTRDAILRELANPPRQ